MSKRKGIAVAGCTLVDVIKEIDGYPKPGMLTAIRSVSRAAGGLLPNVAIDLAVMDPARPPVVSGPVGNDDNGAFVRRTLGSYGIDTDGLTVVPGQATGFTDVMSDRATGERTFFTMEGANADWVPDDAELDRLAARASILHIGYVHLMPGLDAPDEVYGTVLARVLDKARRRGLMTSVDTVSRPGFEPLLRAALPYTDYAVVNEIEACAVTGLEPRDAGGRLIPGVLSEAARRLLSLGVREAVVIHCPEAGVMLRPGKEPLCVPSFVLPDGYIKGSTGAGDAFCAACLYGLAEGWDDGTILRFASAAAACNLSAPDATSGMRPASGVWAIEKTYPKRNINV